MANQYNEVLLLPRPLYYSIRTVRVPTYYCIWIESEIWITYYCGPSPRVLLQVSWEESSCTREDSLVHSTSLLRGHNSEASVPENIQKRHHLLCHYSNSAPTFHVFFVLATWKLGVKNYRVLSRRRTLPTLTNLQVIKPVDHTVWKQPDFSVKWISETINNEHEYKTKARAWPV